MALAHNSLPHSVKTTIHGYADAILEDLRWKIERKELDSIEDCYNVIDETHIDDAAAAYLGLDDQLTLVEEHAEDYGFEPIPVKKIRRRLEGHAAALICYLARAEARVIVEELQDFMNDNDFDLSDIHFSNTYGWARHYAEREEGADCQVYEYRNVEGEVHVDVWEYLLTSDSKIYLFRPITSDELTAAERVFDAH